jgi:hypothetical protein
VGSWLPEAHLPVVAQNNFVMHAFVERRSLAPVTSLIGAREKNFAAMELLDQAMTDLHQLKMGRPRADARTFAPPGSLRHSTPILELSGPTFGTASLIACLPRYGTS